MTLPGTRLLAFARLTIDPIAVERVLEPLVADWQREWLACDTTIRRALVRVRGCVAFICSAAYCCALDDMPQDVRWRAWMTLVTFATLGTVVLAIPMRAWAPRDLLLYLLPSTVTLSIPFAMLPLAILLGTSANRDVSRRHLARLTIIVALLVFALHNWIAPHANQAFREHVTMRRAAEAGRLAEYRPPRRGLGEMTLREVFRLGLSTPGAIASPPKVREELFRRMSLPLVPVLLALMGWCLTRVSSSAGPLRLFGWWVFASITYGFASSLGMTLEHSWSTPREAAAWLPLALWLAASVALRRSIDAGAPGGPEGPALPTNQDPPAI